MQEIDLEAYMLIAREASLAAGSRILEIYHHGNMDIALKSDQSPVTLADKAAHQVIQEMLKKTGLPILSEEGAITPYAKRSKWNLFWLVDPLDGTKEFINQSGEFTVNIALVEKGIPIYGVLYVPVQDVLYYGGRGFGAYKVSAYQQPIPLSPATDSKVSAVVASKSHLNLETEAFIAKNYSDIPLMSMGSSLKLMLLAEQKAQIYPRFGPTMEWDIAAAQAILMAVDGQVLSWPDLKPLIYNKPDLKNPHFLATAFPLAIKKEFN
jgi:3'(2'), 5'-bisphosphate nucleotidase